MNAAYGRAVKWRESGHSGGTGGKCVETASAQGQWRKSSHSTDTGDHRVEVALMVPISAGWRKSRRSTDTGGACVEVADVVSGVAVRDSKDPDGPMLVFGPAAWEAFASRVKGGRLDLS
ncbi:DUF397 domain-containing protein [Actinomadura sp. DSM 109109]|nr:DUF397 domain-containing protein [Actinomadura lepetitiana]